MPSLHHKAPARNSRAWWAARLLGVPVAGCLCLGATGCTKPEVVVPKAKVVMRVQAFTEAQPVRAIAATATYLFVTNGTGLDRWDLKTGERLPLSYEHGLPGTDVFAMAHDATRDWLWVATDGGISRYEVGSSTFSELPKAPEILGIGSLESAVLAPARDGGVWVGLPTGLFYLQSGRGWTKTGIESKVNALYQDVQGALWIAGAKGLMRVDQSGVARTMDAAQTCEFSSVDSVARFDDQHVVLLARSGAGTQVLALASEAGCAIYEDRRGEQAAPWLGVASDASNTYVLTSNRLHKMQLQVAASTAPLESAALTRLKQVSKNPGMTFRGSPELEELGAHMPPDVRIVSTNERSLFLAAGRLGTMEWNPAQGDRPGRWFRRSELSEGADVLSVACESEDSCFLSTASRTSSNALWKWNGEAFAKDESGDRVYGVLALQDGRILSFVDGDVASLPDEDEPSSAPAPAEPGTQAALSARVFENGAWTVVPGLVIETPGESIRIKALRQSPDGQVWVSLDYVDERGENNPYGLAVLDLNLNFVVYHRATFDETSTDRGILPVPVDVTGIGFVGEDEVWLASSQGATRVFGEDIKTHIETDGLRTELLDGLVCSSGGMVYTASSRGVGEWNGERWTYPPVMRTVINDLAIGASGQLWLATDKGLGVYDGSKVRRLDTKRGLVENHITDVESDRFGRIWALSDQGLVLVRR